MTYRVAPCKALPAPIIRYSPLLLPSMWMENFSASTLRRKTRDRSRRVGST